MSILSNRVTSSRTANARTVKWQFASSALSVLFILGATQFSHAEKFYKWVDAKGSTHYTTTPPPKNAKKLGKVSTYNDLSSSAVANNNANRETPNTATDSNNATSATPANNATPNNNAPTNTAPTSNTSNSNNPERIPLPKVTSDPTDDVIPLGSGTSRL